MGTAEADGSVVEMDSESDSSFISSWATHSCLHEIFMDFSKRILFFIRNENNEKDANHFNVLNACVSNSFWVVWKSFLDRLDPGSSECAFEIQRNMPRRIQFLHLLNSHHNQIWTYELFQDLWKSLEFIG